MRVHRSRQPSWAGALASLGLCMLPILSSVAQAQTVRGPNADEERIIREAAEFVRATGWTLDGASMADNIIDYLENEEIQITDEDLADDGETTRDPLGRDTITLEQSLFQFSDQPGLPHERAVVAVAATLVHEKFHAEGQPVIVNGMFRLGRALASLGGAGQIDLVEGTAYSFEFQFLQRAAETLWAQYAELVNEFNLDMHVYNNLIDQFNQGQPTKEDVQRLLRQNEALLERACQIVDLLNRLQAVYEQMKNVAGKYSENVGDAKVGQQMRQEGEKGLREVSGRKPKAEEIKQKLLEQKAFLERLDPPLEPLGFLDPAPPSETIAASRDLLDALAAVDALLATVRGSSDPGTKLGLARPYFDAIAEAIGGSATVEIDLTMIEQRGYIFAAPVVFFMSLREGVIVQVTEAGGSADYRVEVTEGSILSAFVSGDPAAALDAQIQAAEVRVFVGIDVKPGSDPNAINPRSGGVIPVAVLTTAGFDAQAVAPESARFGPARAAALRAALEDVDGDGDLDLVLHFGTAASGVQPGGEEVTLEIRRIDSLPLLGRDAIVTVPK